MAAARATRVFWIALSARFTKKSGFIYRPSGLSLSGVTSDQIIGGQTATFTVRFSSLATCLSTGWRLQKVAWKLSRSTNLNKFATCSDLPRSTRWNYFESGGHRLFEHRNQLAHMIIDHRYCDRWIGKLNVVDVPIGHPIGYLRKPPLDHGAVLGFLQCDHELGVIEVG